MAKDIRYSIKKGKKYLQGIEPNEHYCCSSTAPTMGNRFSYSEYKTIWGDNPVFFERLTASNYIKIIMEEFRWGDLSHTELKIIPLEH